MVHEVVRYLFSKIFSESEKQSNKPDIVFSSSFIQYLETNLELGKDNKIMKIEKMKEGGASTQNFVIQTNHSEKKKKKYLLRTYPGKVKNYSVKEYEVLKLLSESSVAGKFTSKPFFVDPSQKHFDDEFMVMEYLPGIKIKSDILKSKKERIIQSATLLRLLHTSLPKMQTLKSEEKLNELQSLHRNEFELFADIGIIEFSFQYVAENLSKSMLLFSNVPNFSTKAKNLLDRCYKQTKETIRKPFFQNRENRSFLIHGDYHNENLLLEDEVIRVVDWEFARFGSIYEDIAFFICSADLNAEEERLFLKGYFGKEENVNEEFLWIMKVRKYAYVAAALMLGGKNKHTTEIVKKYISKLENVLDER